MENKYMQQEYYSLSDFLWNINLVQEQNRL